MKLNFNKYNKNSSLSNHTLLKLYANGDKESANILIQRLMPKIFSQAYSILGNQNDAEDITQETFIRLWKMAPIWKQDTAEITTWLYQVVKNQCIDKIRKDKKFSDENIEDYQDIKLNAFEELQNKERDKKLYNAISSLPHRQKKVTIMRHIYGYTNYEIADEMNISVEAVESLIARGKRSISQILIKQKVNLGYNNE